MAQVINSNIASLNAQRNLNASQGALNTSLQRLSSGLRINSAKDDAAGLAITERFTAQVRGLDQAIRNANDGVSLAQTAEGALSETVNNLQRIRELAVQAANDTNSASDLASLQGEAQQLIDEIERIANTTQFNGQNLLDGSFTSAQFQVGANANQVIDLSVGSAKASQIGGHHAYGYTMDPDLTAAADGSGGNGTVAQTLTVSGHLGTTEIAVATNGTAREVVEAVNAAEAQSGVRAHASTWASLQMHGNATSGEVSFSLTGADGASVQIQATMSTEDGLGTLARAINATSSTTGITAVEEAYQPAVGHMLTLVSAAGDDIVLENVRGPGADGSEVFYFNGNELVDDQNDDGGNDSGVVGGMVTFSSSKAFTVGSDDSGDTMFGASSVSSELYSVAETNLELPGEARWVISNMDAALEYVNGLRADLGAIQSRFESTIANLSTTAENLSAARSRILDADFAIETAALTRAQILQQAGTSVLAQANQTPQNVLSLLQ